MASGSERRKHPRIPFSQSFSFSRASGAGGKGAVVDISTGGMRFKSGSVLEIGERLSASLKFPNGQVQTIYGVVVARLSAPESYYHVAFVPGTGETVSPVTSD